MKKLWERVAEAMSGKHNSAQLSELHQECNNRIEELEAREVLITDNPNMGQERRRIMDSGSPEDLIRLNTELEETQVELKQLFHRRSELVRLKGVATAEEALADSKKLKKALTDSVKHAKKLERDFLKARAKVESCATAISRGRAACKRQGMHCAELAADDDAADWLSTQLYPGEEPRDRQRRYDFLKNLMSPRTAAELTRGQLVPQQAGVLPSTPIQTRRHLS